MLNAMYGLSSRPLNSNVAAVASALMERLPQFADEVTERICQQVEVYRREQPVARDDHCRSCLQNLEFGFRGLVDVTHHDLSAPRRTGQLRAEQRCAVVHGAQCVSDRIRLHVGLRGHRAERSGLVSATELVRIASDAWTLSEMLTTEMATVWEPRTCCCCSIEVPASCFTPMARICSSRQGSSTSSRSGRSTAPRRRSDCATSTFTCPSRRAPSRPWRSCCVTGRWSPSWREVPSWWSSTRHPPRSGARHVRAGN